MKTLHPSETNPTHQKLAHAFARQLRERLSSEQMQLATVRNRTAPYAGNCCASHDFCDANVYMDLAFAEVMGREMDLQSDADSALWLAAWTLAKRSEFAMA